MNESKDGGSSTSAGLAKAYAWLLLFLAVFVYPLALLPQFTKQGSWYNNLAYNISVPAFLILGLTAIPVLIARRWRVPRTLGIGMIIFAVFWLMNISSLREYWDESVSLLGCITIPLATAVLREKKVLTLARLSYVALGLWVIQVGLGFAALARNNPVVGTPGNRNWMAAMLLLLSPWVFVALSDIFKNRLGARTGRVLAAVILVSPTVILLYHCHSRAAWAALVVAPLGLVFLLFRTRLEKVLYAGLLLTLLGGSLLIGYQRFPGVLLRVVKQDVRLPLWSNTVRMILDHPWGVGAGQYQRTFTPYRIGTYHSRKYAADMTIHPHNEWLNLSAQLGIPVGIALLLLVSPLIRGNFCSPLVNCARISALFVVFQSCFDMPLVQPPVSFLGFMMIGLCWPLTLGQSSPSSKGVITAKALSGVAAIMLAGYFCWYDVQSDLYIRAALLEKALGRKTSSIADSYRKNKKVFDKIQKRSQTHYDRAKQLFKKSITPHRSLQANYEAGVIALNIERNLNYAADHLEHVAGIDRDYAHINILMGRLYLLKKDVAKAGLYFARECLFYPRNIDAWQTWYSFSFRSGQYNRCMDIHAQLEGIYKEQAELNFPGERLLAERAIFIDYLSDPARKKESLSRASGLLSQQKTMDPVFIDLTLEEEWPEKLLGNNIDDLDYLYWVGRYEMWRKLETLGPELTIPELVAWFRKTITPVESETFILPLMVARAKKGDMVSQYACFSDFINLMGGQCIIQLDDAGKPQFAWVCYGDVKKSQLPPGPDRTMTVVKLDFSNINVFKVDLARGVAEPTSLENFKAGFEWLPGRTVIYFSPEEYFMRTQMLGQVLSPEYNFLDTRPPSLRLLELFWITGKQPPTPPVIKEFCFRVPLDLYKYFYDQAPKNLENAKAPPAE